MKNSREIAETQALIRRLRVTARRLIQSFGEGTFRTIFHGRGIEFASLREYVAGDDIRQIDWNTTARRGVPFVKTFIEERDLAIILAIDLSSSMDNKFDSLLKITALLATLADYHDDKLGMIGFTDKVESFIPAGKSPLQPERILHSLTRERGAKQKTSVANALGFLHRVLKKPSIVFLVSDFQDRNFEQRLLALSSRHEIVGIHLYHPYEKELRVSALTEARDAETGVTKLLDGYDKTTRTAYSAAFEQQKQTLFRSFGRCKADFLMLPGNPKVDLQLVEFLRKRQNSRVPIAESIAAPVTPITLR